MFEKEAEEYMKDKFRTTSVTGYQSMKTAYQKGAEYGFQKGIKAKINTTTISDCPIKDEWHYPSKGEYPKECENVLCYCKGLGFKFCCVGHTIVGGDNKVRWWNNCKSEELRVIAWKEIVPPEEE